MIFKEYRIRRLREKLAGKKARLKRITMGVKWNSKIPGTILLDSLDLEEEVARLEKRLEIYVERGDTLG